MKITEELLEKYFAGDCSPLETEFIQNWLASTESETSELSTSELQEMSDNAWNQIAGSTKIETAIKEEGNDSAKVIPMVSKKNAPIVYRLGKVAIAACLGFMLFGAGYHYRNSELEKSIDLVEELNKTKEEALFISTVSGSPEKISMNEYNINFDGVIRLYNDSQTDKIVFCNGKSLLLKPKKVYFIEDQKYDSGYTLAQTAKNFQGLDEYYSPDGNYEICVRS